MRRTRRWGFFAAAALAFAAPALAAPPVPQICDHADSGERLKCKFDNVLQQQLGVAETIGGMDILPPEEEQALADALNRTGRAQNRTQPIEFKQLTRKAKVSCQVQEILGDGSGDDDGICRPGEDCAEVIGDQIGDDDGVCHPRNGAHREVCVEICDVDAVSMDPDNFDDDPAADSRGRDLEETLDGLTTRYEQINGMLETEAGVRAAAAAFAPAGGGACSAVIRARPSTNLVAVLAGAADGVRLSADVAERFCDQTALGFNGSAACAVLEGVAGAARIVANAFLFEGADIDSITTDRIWACLRETATTTSDAAAAVADVGGELDSVSTAIGALDGRVQAVSSRLDLVDRELDQVREQIATTQQALNHVIALLLMPPGQRPGYQE